MPNLNIGIKFFFLSLGCTQQEYCLWIQKSGLKKKFSLLPAVFGMMEQGLLLKALANIDNKHCKAKFQV